MRPLYFTATMRVKINVEVREGCGSKVLEFIADVEDVRCVAPTSPVCVQTVCFRPSLLPHLSVCLPPITIYVCAKVMEAVFIIR